MLFSSVLLLVWCVTTATAATAAQWRSRSIYQIITDRFARSDNSTSAACNVGNRAYCGGTWRGIINKLDYIQNMGFTAIWISPVTQQIQGSTGDGTAYHGYWQNNINALNSAFGSADDLKALSAAVHARGMYLMVDIVVNHFAWNGAPSTVNYASYSPFNSASYFHKYCPITSQDYSSNQTAVEDCWLGDTTVPLTDLDTTNQNVINLYYTWIKNLVSTYSIDGLRIDTVKHVQKSFWPGFNTAAGVYCVGEVFNGDPAFTCPYQNYMDGLLNYPLWYPLTAAFQSTSGSISNLVNEVNSVKSSCKDSTLLGTFLENHDNPRFPSLTSDIALDQNAIAFTMLADGVPIIYEGQEQHYSGSNDPNNREAIWLSSYSTSSTLYTFIAKLNQIRNQAIYRDANYLTYKAYPIYSDTTTIAMRKGFANGQIIGVFSNKGVNGAGYTQTIPSTGFTSGQQVVEILTCAVVTSDANGNIVVPMGKGAARIYYPLAGLTGSGVCGH